jgi:protein-arginine kinase
LKGTEDYFSADLAPAIPVGESIIGTVFPSMTSTEQSTPVIGSIDQVALPADGTKSFTLILLEQFQENANEKALALL